jgi:hypothetical protein
LVWDLPSGPVVKWSCAEHRYRFGGNRGYWVNRTEGYEDNRNPRSHELAALLDVPVASRLGDDAEEGPRTCVDPDCLNPARRGEFCNECLSRWKEEQRDKARRERRSTNVQRGF